MPRNECPKIRSSISSEEQLEDLRFDDEQNIEYEEPEEKCPECSSIYLETVPFFDKRFKCGECGYEWEP